MRHGRGFLEKEVIQPNSTRKRKLGWNSSLTKTQPHPYSIKRPQPSHELAKGCDEEIRIRELGHSQLV